MATSTGLVSVQTGSPVVSGNLTSFVAAEGDQFILRGLTVVIDRAVSSSQILLKQPWSGPSIGNASDWDISLTSPAWNSTVLTNKRLNDLLTKFEAGPIKWDAAGLPAERANYNSQGVNFVFLAVGDPWVLYTKLANTGAASDWSPGQAIKGSEAASTAEAKAAAADAQGSASAASSAAGTAVGAAGTASAAASATAVDRAQTGQDRAQTGADRTQTGQDRATASAAAAASASDRSQTGQDRAQTGQDRVVTTAAAAQALASATSVSGTVGQVDALGRMALYRDGLDGGDGFVDLSGRMPLRFDTQGVATLAALLLMGGESYRDTSGYALTIRDLANRIGLSLDLSGELFADRLAVSGSAYRDAHDYPFRVTDAAGRLGFGLDRTGAAYLYSLVLAGELSADRVTLPGGPYRDAYDYPFRIADTAGRFPFGIDAAGLTYLLGLVMAATPSLTRDAYPYLFDLSDAVGQTAIGVEGDGRVMLRLSSLAVQRVAEDLYIPPARWRGTEVAFNVRRTSTALIATMQDADGRAYDARQRLDGTLSSALADAPGSVEGVYWYGQSNAGGGGSNELATLTKPTYPRHALTFSAGYQVYDDTALPAATLTDLAPAAESGVYNPYPAIAFGVALEGRARKESRATPAYFVHTNWYGGQPIATFVRGTIAWNNLMTSIAGSQSVVAKYGRSCVPKAIVWVQGENWTTNYQSDLAAFLPDLRAGAAAVSGQPAPAILMAQTNMGTNDASPSGAELAQWTVAVAQAGQGVTMVGPMYQFPFGAGSDIHQGVVGRMMFGELVALVYDRVVRQGLAFNPLWPTNVSRSGAVITLTFARPPGGGALAFDTAWVPQATNYGFAYADDAGSATIQSVAITGANTVAVTLSNAPTGANPKLRYGQGQGARTGWAGGRGNLISPSGQASYFAALGYAVPATINHYAIRFEVTVP